MRRFVTYLYEYDKGNRGKNSGFIRIDVRNEEVQMEVHLRNSLHCGEKGTMYLLVRENEQIFGIEIGDIVVTNGRGERTFTFSEQNIEESGYSFEQVIGIGMRCEKEGYLASNWTDEEYEELTKGSFSVFRHSVDVSSQQAHVENNSSFTLSNTSYSEMLTEEESPKEEEFQKEEKSKKQEDTSVFSLNPSYMEDIHNMEDRTKQLLEEESDSSFTPQILQYKENENFDTSLNCEYKEETLPFTSSNAFSSECQTSELCVNVKENQIEEQMKMEKLKLMEQFSNIQEETCDCNKQDVISENETTPTSKTPIVWWREQIEALLQADILENPKSDCNSQNKKTWNTDYFTQTYSEEIPQKRCSYQKISVSDIRNLPSPNWYLCNNNFLLHGFFNYEYLIIKKEKINDKERFYLGVPGVFEKQEKAMAMMFGFPYFECCSPEELENQQEFEQTEKKEEPKEGDFGCWYLLLNI